MLFTIIKSSYRVMIQRPAFVPFEKGRLNLLSNEVSSRIKQSFADLSENGRILFVCILAFLISNGAACLASGLARGLALSAGFRASRLLDASG